MGLEEAFKALGLAAEFTPAAAVYAIFLWLDRKSSDESRQAISLWTRGEQYRALGLHPPMVALFDRIYSHPLLRMRAFVRSALITTAIFIPWVTALELSPYYTSRSGTLVYIALLGGNVLSDYVSLFAVRAILKVARRHLIVSLLIAPMAAVVIVFVFFDLALNTLVFVQARGFLFALHHYWIRVIESPVSWWSPWHTSRIAPAFIVHLWLPLFGVGVFGLRMLQAWLYVTGKTQWFMRDGSNHPIEAAGVIAAVAVFVGTGLYHLVRLELS